MYQRVTVVGFLGRDPEMRQTAAGTPVTGFSLATTDRWKDRDGNKRESKVWWNVSAFGKLAELCNDFVEKGSFVLIEGKLQADEDGNPEIWFTNDNTPRASNKLTASVVRFLPSGSGPAKELKDEDAEDDSIPF